MNRKLEGQKEKKRKKDKRMKEKRKTEGNKKSSCYTLNYNTLISIWGEYGSKWKNFAKLVNYSRDHYA